MINRNDNQTLDDSSSETITFKLRDGLKQHQTLKSRGGGGLPRKSNLPTPVNLPQNPRRSPIITRSQTMHLAKVSKNIKPDIKATIIQTKPQLTRQLTKNIEAVINVVEKKCLEFNEVQDVNNKYNEENNIKNLNNKYDKDKKVNDILRSSSDEKFVLRSYNHIVKSSLYKDLDQVSISMDMMLKEMDKDRFLNDILEESRKYPNITENYVRNELSIIKNSLLLGQKLFTNVSNKDFEKTLPPSELMSMIKDLHEVSLKDQPEELVVIADNYDTGFSGKYRKIATNLKQEGRVFRDQAKPIMNKLYSSIMSKKFYTHRSLDEKQLQGLLTFETEHIFPQMLGNPKNRVMSLYRSISDSNLLPTSTFLNNWQNKTELLKLCHQYKTAHDTVNIELLKDSLNERLNNVTKKTYHELKIYNKNKIK